MVPRPLKNQVETPRCVHNYMDAETMETMLKMEGNLFTITNKEPSDPSAFIVPFLGQLNNRTWVRFSENVGKKVCNAGKKVCNASPNVLFNIFNKMNSNLAYFDIP